MKATAQSSQQPSGAGYSGTPLLKKLGIKTGATVYVYNAPPHYFALLGDLPEGVVLHEHEQPPHAVTFAHLFSNSRAELEHQLLSCLRVMTQDASIWVSWHKKASKLPTEITEDSIREIALPLGLVDVKVCAVDEVWSGLKLVLRKNLRGK